MVKIAIIGAGISGLALANTIKNNADVELFEKSRGFGGRVATRRAGDFS
ncbi:MAG: NAD(P)-binding protein, partial [Rhizobiales bacterium]|nr:NAD(P)-binding protein [Hyphomicrobiales bacterium]